MRRLSAILIVLFAGLLAPRSASAGDNDLTLQRFGECVAVGLAQCGSVRIDEDAFRLLTRDLGLVTFPRLRASAETLGQAGFAFQVDHSFSVVDANSDRWRRAHVDEQPNGTLMTTQLHLRKGLPMSLELGTMATFLWQSDLVAIGAELKWALHEDTLWPVPDLMIRGFGNTVLGHPQLLLTNAGVDIVTGLPIGAGNVMNITPYAGYTMLLVIAGTQIIDATPGDPLPPVVSTDPSATNQPEFSFDVEAQIVHQALLGLRFQFGVVNALFEVNANKHVQSYGLTLGADF